MVAEATRPRCHVITNDGQRCKRPAGESGFCYQHDDNNETIKEYDRETGKGAVGVRGTAGSQGRER